MDIATGKVLVDNLATLWAGHNSNSSLKEPMPCVNPTLQVKPKRFYKHLFKRIKKFNQNRYQRWSNKELYQLAELIWIERQGYKRAAVLLGRSQASCRQMMYTMRKASILGTKGQA